MTSPSVSFVAVWIEASSRFSMPGFSTSRSTTTSIVWFFRLSSAISSSSDRSSPSMRARTNPCRAELLQLFLVFALAAAHDRRQDHHSLVCCSASTCCRICSVLCRAISKPQSGQCGTPIDEYSSRR